MIRMKDYLVNMAMKHGKKQEFLIETYRKALDL